MLSDPTVALKNAAAIQALYRFTGPLSKDGPVLSLAWYAANDLAWRQDLVARKTLKIIDPTSHLTLVSYDKQHQRGVKPWSWQSLLPRVALDQTVFRQMLRKGAAAGNLLRTVDTSSRTLWQRFDLSARLAREIYCTYLCQTSSLLGTSLRPEKELLPMFFKLGYARIESEPAMAPLLPRAATLSAALQRRYVRHWFAHALTNLIQYQRGELPLDWHPDGCRFSCWQTVKQYRLKMLSKRMSAASRVSSTEACRITSEPDS